MKAFNMDIDHQQDFAGVETVQITERLTAEEIEDGIEPAVIDLKVGISRHVYNRMYDTVGRHVDWEDIERLIRRKGHKLFNLKHGDQFAIVNDKETLGLVCTLLVSKGVITLSLITVIRKVIVGKDFRETEKRVFFSPSMRCI